MLSLHRDTGNNRRESKQATAPKVVLAQARAQCSQQPNSITSDEAATSDDVYEENVQTLTTLVNAKTPPPAHAVQQLLDDTRRSKRIDWLKSLISIREILEKYPCFKHSKWVCS